jgi:hypothetical protein
MYFTAKVMMAFPNMGLPEIMSLVLPPPVKSAVLLLLLPLWYFAGAITLLSFVDVTLRFISPDVPAYLLMIGFLLIVCTSCRLNSTAILFGLEWVIVLNAPLIALFLLKTLTEYTFRWDAVWRFSNFVWDVPTYSALSAASYIFTGYSNIIIFNRVIHRFNVKLWWAVPVFGCGILLTTFFIPIGYLGVMGVGTHVYPWFSTADSIQVTKFVIERVLFVFYLIYITMALVSTTVHWHVGLELAKAAFRFGTGTGTGKRSGIISWIIVGLFSIVTLKLLVLGQEELYSLGVLLLKVVFASQFGLLLLLYGLKRRSRV